MISHLLVCMWRLDRPTGRDQLAEPIRSGDSGLFLCGPDFAFTGDVSPPAATTWGSISGFSSERGALAALGAIDTGAGPATESWHAVAAVTSHRGAVNWTALAGDEAALTPVAHEVPGPLAVITTAGFDLGSTFDLDPVIEWFTEFQAVRDSMATTPGLVLQQYFQPELPWDPLTFTLWRDEASMRAFAYRPGPHRQRLDWYRDDPAGKADRTSFTRLRIIAASGTWGGADPLESTCSN